MTNKNKRSKLLAMSLLTMLLLVLTTGAILLKGSSNEYEYEIVIDFENHDPYGYKFQRESFNKFQRELKRIEIEKKAEEIRLAEEARLAEIARIEAEKKRKTELEKERLRRLEEKKKQVATVSRGNTSTSQWIQFDASYYSAFCDTGCTGFTKLGWDVRNTIYHNGHRVIAVDPKVIPLGSLVQVKTPYETFYALAGDTGGAIKRYRIDILVDSTKTAYKLGRHPVQVRMIK